MLTTTKLSLFQKNELTPNASIARMKKNPFIRTENKFYQITQTDDLSNFKTPLFLRSQSSVGTIKIPYYK